MIVIIGSIPPSGRDGSDMGYPQLMFGQRPERQFLLYPDA